jgi:curved DNA-binding protein
MLDYYNILGVGKTATQDEIKKAYRKLASQHHPDKGGDTAKFQEIQTAYATLSDDQKRAAYDNPSPFGPGAGFAPGGQPFDFDSIFNMFGAQFRQPHSQQRPQARMSLWISLKDVATCGSRIVSMGTQNGSQEISIDIPQGINDGDNVRYSGLGPNGTDLIIQFRVHPEKNWARSDHNLITEITVSVWKLIAGGTINIADIRGNKLELTVPPKTQPGTMLRAKARGLPDQRGNLGDMLIRLNARIPPTVSPELMAAIAKESEQ